nr:MAG TPA: hypothetical protein [Caudoviricetes sp.]DAS76214.1 MAG TPA: hypothetical protein [Caudoviricetes sp.]
MPRGSFSVSFLNSSTVHSIFIFFFTSLSGKPLVSF